jgi:hypothetical protein
MADELQSWKELANYLGVSVRTVQLWERTRALPVRRLPGPNGGVLAVPSEIDKWRTAQPAPPPHPAYLLHASLVLLSFLAGAAAIWWYLRPSPLHHFTVDNGIVTAFDRQGHPSWTFHSGTNSPTGPGTYFTRVTQTDLDADGSDELLVTRELPNTNHVLYCFNARGDVLWTRSLGRTVQTAVETLEPPFQARGFEVLRGFPDGIPRIVTVAFHHLWYPSQLQILDIQGRILGEYWHSGHLTAFTLFDLDLDGHPELIVAGINQASKSAEVAVLDPFHLTGASSEENPAFQFLNMPTGVERARFVLKPSHISRLTAAYNVPVALFPKRDTLLLDVHEGTGVGTPGNALTYEFNRQLQVLSISPSDQFALSQAAFVRAGKLSRALTPADLVLELPLRWIKPWSNLAK